jgi:hypothetical protein
MQAAPVIDAQVTPEFMLPMVTFWKIGVLFGVWFPLQRPG